MEGQPRYQPTETFHDEDRGRKTMAEYGIENMDGRTREKVENARGAAERLKATLDNLLKLVDFCTDKGIILKDKATDGVPDLRTPEGAAEIAKQLNQLADMAVDAQYSITANSIPGQYKEEVEALMQK